MSPRRTGTLRFLGIVLGVIGVSLLVVGAWRRLLQSRNNADPALVALAAIVVVGVFVIVIWWSVHRSRARQLTVATLRPGWQLHGVWADGSLSRELVKQGVWEPGLRPSGGSRLTLAWSTWGIELWRGGRTPYVVGALRSAAAAGAHTVLVSSNPGAAAGREVDVHIAVDTGPEAVSGSTRMKAGTAAKLVLNAMSTAVMVRLGRTYSNLMVSMSALNSKLRGRLVKILVEATGMDAETCEAALADAAGDTRTALVSLLCDVPTARAAEALAGSGGSVREAMRTIRGDS